ncbi:hypothetical protein MLD38_013675 [Melastoma candidum]|uniref:Uncharacterized protein n=1 Tax=Melastoma candidum TaxID=119954 RepID=A0ACB9RAA9_9MYRT|nr:hypothetical protein MLD38_013675 [Melastoma candidum]
MASASLKLAVLLVVAAAVPMALPVTAAPAPSADCSSLLITMADCLTFVSNGSTLQKPQGNCCGGLLTVVETDPGCLCKGFHDSASQGVSLDLAKTKALPPLCKIPSYIIPNCDATSPTGTPATGATPSTPTEADSTPSTPTVAATTQNSSPVASAPGPAASAASSLVVLSSSAVTIAAAATASWFLI